MERFATNQELVAFLRRLAKLGGLLAGLIVAGTLGYMVVGGSSVWRGFVETLDTVSTLGAIPTPHDTGVEALRVVLLILGVGTLFYGLVTVTDFFVSGHLGELLEERRTLRMINALNDHYVICGFGRVGRQVARDLAAAGARYVIVDADPANREHVEGVGARFLEGSPSEDDVLRQAGLERARAVIACVDSDAENIFITLTARELRSDITIVARASFAASEQKLKRAGADRVISPYKASGSEMARLALHPQVAGVVDVSPEFRMEEIEVSPGCAGSGQTIGDIRGGSIIVAVKSPEGAINPQPPGETPLHDGDVIVALGTPATLERLEALFTPAAAG